jgi:protein required for attachment to host cells
MTPTTWIVAADASRARVLQIMDRNHLSEVENFANPAGRMHGRDLLTESHPRFDGHGGVGKAGTSTTGGQGNDREEISPSEQEAAKFCKELGHFLDKARMEHRYDRLFLIAPPRFLGMMRKEIGKEVQKLIAEEIHKDVSWLNPSDIERYIK